MNALDDATLARRATDRERIAATLAQADAAIEDIRNRSIPDALWEAPAAPPPEPPRPTVQRSAPAVGSARPTAGASASPPSYVTRARLAKELDWLVQGVGRTMRIFNEGHERRVLEAERRIRELEARLAKLEARNG